MELEEFLKRRAAAAETENASAWMKLARIELLDLFESIPESLDSALNIVFPRAQYIDNALSATGFGYRSLIDDRPVRLEEHQQVCRWVLDKLLEIVRWCRRYKVPTKQILVDAKSRVEVRLGKAICNSKHSPLFWFAILDDLDSGRDVEILLPAVCEWNVKTLISPIRELFPLALIAAGIMPKETPPVSEVGRGRSSSNTEVGEEWSKLHPPGVWYAVFEMSAQQWRKALKTSWIPNGDARRDPQAQNRGKVQFRKSLLINRGLKEPD